MDKDWRRDLEHWLEPYLQKLGNKTRRRMCPAYTRRRVVEVHSLADEVQIFEGDKLIARHPMLEGRRERSLLPGHRKSAGKRESKAVAPPAYGDQVVRRPLEIYEAIGKRLAASGGIA